MCLCIIYQEIIHTVIAFSNTNSVITLLNDLSKIKFLKCLVVCWKAFPHKSEDYSVNYKQWMGYCFEDFKNLCCRSTYVQKVTVIYLFNIWFNHCRPVYLLPICSENLCKRNVEQARVRQWRHLPSPRHHNRRGSPTTPFSHSQYVRSTHTHSHTEQFHQNHKHALEHVYSLVPYP